MRLVAALVVSLTCAPASADDKDACIEAHEQAQLLRAHEALRAARKKLLECANLCPPMVERECLGWLEEVEASQPTMVFEVRDRAGRETAAARVRVDGERLLERVGGAAVPVDPGEHTFSFEKAGERPVDRRIIVRQGEKNRRLAIRFGPEPAPPSPPQEENDAGPIAAWVLGGIGVAAMATFAGFAIAGRMKEDELAQCAPRCSDEEADVMYQRYIAADIALGIGVTTLVASGVIAIWYLSTSDASDAVRQPFALTF